MEKITVYYKYQKPAKLFWFYKTDVILLTHIDNMRSKVGSYILEDDGYIYKIQKNGRNCKAGNGLSRMISDEVKDGEKACACCSIVLPISHFVHGKRVRSNELTRKCKKCREHSRKSRVKSSSKHKERKSFVDKRRVEIIKERGGCQNVLGCIYNQHLHEISDEMLLAMYEFNHIDGKKKLYNLSSHCFFTDARAQKHGFTSYKELWEAEANKCEVLCRAHHVLYTKLQTKKNCDKAYNL